MTQIKAIIFDQDGVVIDSERIHVKAERAIFDKYNLVVSEEKHRKMKGLTAQAIFNEVLKEHKLNKKIEDLIKEKRKIWFEICKKELKIFPGFYDLITRIKGKYKLALTTSASLETITFVKTLFPHLRGIFEIEITADDVKKGKPDPEPYLITAKKLKLKPEECLVIEDSLNGIISAKRAGMKVIALASSYSIEELQVAKPDIIVKSLNEINLKLINKL